MKLAALALVALLMGCVHPMAREFQDWATLNKLRAERGEIKWSDHYREAFNRMAALPSLPGKSEAMESANTLTMAAELYESGRMSKELFESMQRTALAAEERRAEGQSTAARQAMGQALRNFGNAAYGPEATKARQIPYTPPPPSITCHTMGAYTTCN